MPSLPGWSSLDADDALGVMLLERCEPGTPLPYDATQHLLNCEARLWSDPDGTIRRFSDLLGLDHGRVRLWIFARLAAEPRDDWQADSRMELARPWRPGDDARQAAA